MGRSKLEAKRRKAMALQLGKLIEAVDFPDFVAALIDGTFQVIVDGSARQMEAYASLVKDVASALDEFTKDEVSAERARDRLIERYGLLLRPSWPPKRQRSAPARTTRRKTGRRLAPERQQLLATMVLMGINRIVVTDGRISAVVSRRSSQRGVKRAGG